MVLYRSRGFHLSEEENFVKRQKDAMTPRLDPVTHFDRFETFTFPLSSEQQLKRSHPKTAVLPDRVRLPNTALDEIKNFREQNILYKKKWLLSRVVK